MRPLKIDCAEANRKVLLKRNLQEGIEVDLENLDYAVDGVLCEILAMSHSMRPENKCLSGEGKEGGGKQQRSPR